MAIVKQTNKNGVTYVYESYSYRDPETKQPRAKRKLIGRIDETTGEVVPTHTKRKSVTTKSDISVATNISSEDDEKTKTDNTSESGSTEVEKEGEYDDGIEWGPLE